MDEDKARDFKLQFKNNEFIIHGVSACHLLVGGNSSNFTTLVT